MLQKVFIFTLFLWHVCDAQMYRPYDQSFRRPDIIIYPMQDDSHARGPLYVSNQNAPRPLPPALVRPIGDAVKPSTESPKKVSEPADDNSSLPIPLDFLAKINSYNDINDLLLNLVEGVDDDEPQLGNRFGESDGMNERGSAVVPKAAGCIPELQTVRLVPNNDHSVFYIPPCTRIERCGGCCGSDLLTCQPTQTEQVNFKVYKTQFGGGEKLSLKSKEIVVVDRHTKCKCDCKIKAEDCTPLQEYRKNSCKCVCANLDEHRKCRSKSEQKIWNSHSCSCDCRNEQNCTTGYGFDPNQCICVPLPERRRYAQFSSRKT